MRLGPALGVPGEIDAGLLQSRRPKGLARARLLRERVFEKVIVEIRAEYDRPPIAQLPITVLEIEMVWVFTRRFSPARLARKPDQLPPNEGRFENPGVQFSRRSDRA
jgi:hypothetical protein